MNRNNKFVKIITSTLTIFLFGIIILTFLSLFGIPQNFRIFVVETGSMSPTINAGSLAFVIPQTNYQKGDIITFNTPLEKDEQKNYVVTHRINDVKSENGDVLFETKGDANNAPDTLLTNQIHVIGKVSGAIPLLGYLIGFAKTQIGFLLVIIIPSLLIIYSEIQSISREFKKNSRRKKNLPDNLEYA